MAIFIKIELRNSVWKSLYLTCFEKFVQDNKLNDFSKQVDSQTKKSYIELRGFVPVHTRQPQRHKSALSVLWQFMSNSYNYVTDFLPAHAR